MDYRYHRGNQQNSSRLNVHGAQQSQTSTASIGENAVKSILQTIITEIEKKCDDIVKKTVKTLEAKDLEELISKTDQSNTDATSLNGESNENQLTTALLGLPPNYTVVYSDQFECLKILRDRTAALEQALETLNTLAEFGMFEIVETVA